MTCGATALDHCCWLAGAVCAHFDPDPPDTAGGFCALRTELGDWAKVHADPRWLRDVGPALARGGIADCGSWPTTGTRCGTCQVDGR